MNENIISFIPSAGYGERLRPLTDYIPKPLLPILGKPALERVIKRVSEIGIKKIGINLHHKKELITGWLKETNLLNFKNITLFYENQLLGTGGGLKNAEIFLKENHFLVYNSDIVTNIDLLKLIYHHLNSSNIATLAVQNLSLFNKLIVDNDGFLKGLSDGQNSKKLNNLYAFTGIAIYSPDFLNFLPPGPSDVTEGWIQALSKGKKIGCLIFNDHYWNDIGTPERYIHTIINELKSEGEIVYVSPKTKNIKNIQFDGYLVIEKDCFIEEASSFKNCILLPGAHIKRGHYENCILGDNFKIQLNERVFKGISNKDFPIQVGFGASDRKYFRIKKEDKTFILLKTSQDDPDFIRQIELTRLFNQLGIPVPQLISVDHNHCEATFEDLGDVTLYSWLKIPRKIEEIEFIYKKVIDCLLMIHLKASRYIIEHQNIELKIFDYEHLKWESDYFINRFIIGILGIELKNPQPLLDELSKLALTVDSFEKGLMHRDFQSQNIMITATQEIGIIDYQSARIGPQAYDVASLLWDAYYQIDENSREKLLEYYIKERRRENNFSEKKFLQLLQLCRIQRHMQALGAYGYISKIKGKKNFLKYIPQGVKLLKDAVYSLKYEYPELYKLILLI